jgi:hypothetical protein
MIVPANKKRPAPTVLLTIHVPTDLALAGAKDDQVLGHINKLIRARGGIILANGQILYRELKSEWIAEEYYDDDRTSDWDHPLREWGEAHESYFGAILGFSNPFQYGEQPDVYGRYCLEAYVPGDYLGPAEQVLALVDCGLDSRNFYCPCHYAEVVYTSAHRLVCMACGQMHCVLSEHLSGVPGGGWAEAKWHESFDVDGLLLAHDLRVPFIEYQDVFQATKLWETDAWVEASSEIEFFERGDPEEVARYRATLPTAEDFMEAGWTESPMPPPPARQMEPEGIDIHIGRNAALALQDAAKHYAASVIDPSQVRSAVLDLFQAIELLLKIKLEIATGDVSTRRKNNPEVIRALAACGEGLPAEDARLVAALRELRNRLQHSEGRVGYADTRALIARGFVMIDRFAWEALGWWIADAIDPPMWDSLLALPEIASSAALRAEELGTKFRAEDPLNSIERCPHCSRETVIRERSHAGYCLFCRRIPVRNRENS